MGDEQVREMVVSFSDIGDQILLFLPKFAAGLVVFLIFWAAGCLVRRIVRRIFKRHELNRDVEELIEQAVHITLLTLGALTALGTMGVDIAALIASLGLVGFAVGFALKDAISNYLAGILILAYRPFEREDQIAVAGHRGIVVDIDMRYTILDTEERRVLVPNAQLFNNVVTVEKTPKT
ncbi:MAG: mechanosensitive ion channel family protein [Anaerolineae bacterium]